ncbi:MAG: AMP-binding protein, partial [bacterium]|nr:AMP-binding protein [bacterium]
WQNQLFESDGIRSQWDYWLEIYADAADIQHLELPVDHPRPGVYTYAGDRSGFKLEAEEAAGFKDLALRCSGTLYMNFLAALNTLFYIYTRQTDIIIGSGIAGRPHADLQRIIGVFINTVSIRNQPQGDKTYQFFLEEVVQRGIDAFENQDVQFEELVDRLNIPRDTSRNPLFDVCLMGQNIRPPGEQTMEFPTDGQLPQGEYKNNTTKFDMTFHILERGEEVTIIVEYYTGIFNPGTVQRFGQHFKNLIKTVISDPSQRLTDIEIISPEEKSEVLYTFNDTASQYPSDKTIHQLFEEQADKTPDRIAVTHKGESLTYSQLNSQSYQLALHLPEQGVESESIVALRLERSLEMIIAILGTLKAGGAYLPIEMSYPEKRVGYMLKDSGAKVLICSDLPRSDTPPPAGGGVPLSRGELAGMRLINLTGMNGSDYPDWEAVNSLNARGFYSPLERGTRRVAYKGGCNQRRTGETVSHKANQLCYIIYTSGSTGNPKGVMVNHRSVVRLVIDTDYVEFREGDRILQTGALSFDASTFEIWGALLNGLGLFLAGKEEILTPRGLKRGMLNYDIAIMWMTAPLFNQMLDEDIGIFSTLRNLLVGGDVLSPLHIDHVRNRFPSLNIINGYGPTENTTFSTTHLITGQSPGSIPIGRPIANSTVYIVDNNGRPRPIGVAGEIWVGGDGVSRGYLNNPELTSEKFFGVQGRFFKKAPGRRRQRIYRTGDMGKWRPDGIIEFLGRIDTQVKVRGFRIELEEIENRLKRFPLVTDAVVIAGQSPGAGDNGGDKVLCAYIVAEDEIETPNVRDYLSNRLPDFMLPSYFVQLDKIPLTVNGKVDRGALPVPGIVAGSSEYAAPRDGMEEQLAEIWSRVLHIPKDTIGIDDNFFELGGHSLKAAALTARIYKTMNLEIPLVEVFRCPTLRELSRYIAQQALEDPGQTVYLPIPSVEEKDYYPLSSSQERLYTLQTLYPDSTFYNMTETLQLRRDLDKPKLEKIFKQIIQRHESLRTSFETIRDVPVQRVHSNVPFTLQQVRLKENVNPGDSRMTDIVADVTRPFDLGRAPLVRACLITGENENDHTLIVDMHHIISDEASHKVLAREFLALCDGETLTGLPVQYKDYINWQSGDAWQLKWARQEKFWISQFPGDPPVLELPTDYPRPLEKNFEGNTVMFEFSQWET